MHFQNKQISYDYERYVVDMKSLVNVEQIFGRFDDNQVLSPYLVEESANVQYNNQLVHGLWVSQEARSIFITQASQYYKIMKDLLYYNILNV